MLIVVIDGIVINSQEPLLLSSLRQVIERNMPREAREWAACYIVAVEAVGCVMGEKEVKSISN